MAIYEDLVRKLRGWFRRLQHEQDHIRDATFHSLKSLLTGFETRACKKLEDGMGPVKGIFVAGTTLQDRTPPSLELQVSGRLRRASRKAPRAVEQAL